MVRFHALPVQWEGQVRAGVCWAKAERPPLSTLPVTLEKTVRIKVHRQEIKLLKVVLVAALRLVIPVMNIQFRKASRESTHCGEYALKVMQKCASQIWMY